MFIYIYIYIYIHSLRQNGLRAMLGMRSQAYHSSRLCSASAINTQEDSDNDSQQGRHWHGDLARSNPGKMQLEP